MTVHKQVVSDINYDSKFKNLMLILKFIVDNVCARFSSVGYEIQREYKNRYLAVEI